MEANEFLERMASHEVAVMLHFPASTISARIENGFLKPYSFVKGEKINGKILACGGGCKSVDGRNSQH